VKIVLVSLAVIEIVCKDMW